VALYLLLVAFPLGWHNTALRLRTAARTAGLPPTVVRALVFGRRYTAAIEQIRSTIPLDEPYLIREMDEPGAMLWVRFDLLPRRAIRAEGTSAPAFDCWRGQVRWEIVAAGVGRPPLLLERPAATPPGCPPAPWRKTPS
jgi:hypothetical protein